ncbi:MAG: hypothetical protein E3K40_08590 [Candidatus Brocadia sp.]|nr:hypothetical protein [Candidatus Brocadia sp.]MDG6026748.1 hypothetical protein [Candidatus Brocadia sp.]
MAENTVVKDQLTDAMVEAGAELTRTLDEVGLATKAALWLFVPEINEWRLLFALTEVSEQGPRKVYEQIRLALQQLGDKASAAPLSVIGLLDENAELVKLLRIAISTGPGIGRIRFSKNVINGRFIEDALIYRVV